MTMKLPVLASRLLLPLFLCQVASAAGPDVVYADFEGADYGAWVKTGDAFGPGPAKGALAGQMNVEGFLGKGLVNSFFGGDNAKGTLTSPEFKIERRAIHFLIGGGGYQDETCLNLLVDGKVVRTAGGPNVEPGGSERLVPGGWDVSDLQGKTAKLQIVDQRGGSWGHINVDQIVFSDREAPKAAPIVKRLKNQTREIALDDRYLLFPTKTGDKAHRVALLIDGKQVRDFKIELSDTPTFWTQLDVSAWKGKKATLRVDWLSEDSQALASIKPSAEIWGADQVYHEALRGQLHFSPKRGWNNDPNGMVYAQGEYHLYFQHNPYGWGWENMHWGHAVSRDLVHWEELPVALYPPVYDDMAFSGSAIVDKDNTSGWKKGDNDLIVAAFTSTGRGECIAYSNDKGRTFTEFEGNPVVKHQGRDPRLLWHKESKQWVMAVYTEDPGAPRGIAFYTSPDLKKFTFQSRIADYFECPDIFELAVDGDAKNSKWVLTAASSSYQVGTFDGKTFTPETKMLPGHRGHGFYAAQTYSHDPKGRTIQVGWFQTESKGMPFNQSMTLPLQLTLRGTAEGPRIARQPAEELNKLRGKTVQVPNFDLDGKDRAIDGVAGELLEVRATIKPGAEGEAGVKVRGLEVFYDAKNKQLRVQDVKVPVTLRDGKIDLIVYTDRNSVEIFGADGLVYIPLNRVLPAAQTVVSVFSRGGPASFSDVAAYELKSIWEK
jgi:fructan beta-fructosidase